MTQTAAAAAPKDENEIVRKHDRLIRSLASKFSLLDLDDLCQIGRLALVEASRKWSPDRGTQLWTYARSAVIGAMIDAVTAELARVRLEISDDVDVDFDALEKELSLTVDEALMLKSLLAILDTEEAEIVRLHIVEDVDFRTIADRTGKGIGTVFRMYSAALERMRAWAAA